MPESLQHKLDRVRRPRVQITYDVETGGAMKAVELPFVVGVLADLSGQPKEALRPLKERKAVNIDRDNFNDVLTKAGARLAMRVPNMLTDPKSKLAVELIFKHVDDFEPARVAEQIGPLKQLLDMRKELTQLLSRMEGNDKLEQLLESILTNQQKALALEQYMDSQARLAPAVAAAAPAPAVQEETPAEEPPSESSPAAAAEEPPAPAPAEEAAGDADINALLASLESPANPEEPAGEAPASAPAPAEGGGQGAG
jgi:type VI secretion system protein ImpB